MFLSLKKNYLVKLGSIEAGGKNYEVLVLKLIKLFVSSYFWVDISFNSTRFATASTK